MRKFNVLFLLTIIFFAFSSQVFAAAKGKKEEKIVESKYSYEYREIASLISAPCAPYEKDGHIVFTSYDGPRHIGIVFDFENYQVIHSFLRKTTTDIDENPESTLYFYILEQPPKDVEQISYRLIIDGIWTTDPMNPDTSYDTSTGIKVSRFVREKKEKMQTEITKDNGVHFIYYGKSGQLIRLSGTFTNWDSWIYEMKETKPGCYELYLPLPKGKYLYTYCCGTRSFPDHENPDRAFSEDGKQVSILYVY